MDVIPASFDFGPFKQLTVSISALHLILPRTAYLDRKRPNTVLCCQMCSLGADEFKNDDTTKSDQSFIESEF